MKQSSKVCPSPYTRHNLSGFNRSLWSLFFLFCALGPLAHPALAARRSLDRSVVTVNDEVILESDIKAFREKLKSAGFRDLFGGLTEKSINDRKTLISLLIEEKIIDQRVKKLDMSASDMEIDRQIRVISEKNGITQDQLKAQLKRLGTDFKDYRDGIKRQIERRSLIDREIRPTLEVSDDQLKNYYQQVYAKKRGGETKFHIAHIFVQGTGKEQKTRIEKIYSELKKDLSKFPELVAQYSDDASTSENGGDLGNLSLDSLSEVFRSSVPKTEPGKVTAPLKGKEGYHIVKVLGTGKSGFDDLSREEKLQLRNEMAATELEKKMAMWLERKKGESHLKFAKEL